MQNLVKCDKCGKLDDMYYGCYNHEYCLPSGWENTDAGDLCPDCKKKYKEHLGKF